jgi:hypothetical protein
MAARIGWAVGDAAFCAQSVQMIADVARAFPGAATEARRALGWTIEDDQAAPDFGATPESAED